LTYALRVRREAIRDLPFRHNLKPGLGFEIFRLAELFRRVPHDELRSPQRPEFHTLYVGLTGKGSMVVDFTEVPVGAGVLTVVARGRVQQFKPRDGLDAWMLLFSPEFISGQYAVLDPTWERPTAKLERDLIVLAEQLAQEQARPLDAAQAPLLEALLTAVILRAERSVDLPVTTGALQKFFTILERDCLRTRETTHYARQAGVSPRQLASLLVEHTGRSTKRVIDDRVVLEQKRLLAHTDLSVKQLADRTGFAEPTNLVKFFKQRVGMTPQEFRQNLPSGRRS
jgi:AraC-like DNA-binding protein